MAEEPPTDQAHPKMAKEKPPKKSSAAPFFRRGGGSAARGLCSCILTLLFLAGLIILILYLVYRPHKPRFTVVGAAVYELNVTAPPFISTSMQFTLITRNPNRRVDIYYRRLTAYVTYQDQPITPRLQLPPLYHETKSSVLVSPVLGGGGPVMVSPEVANGLMMDNSYGVIPLRVVFTGRLRWKTGPIHTATYGIDVKCDIWIGLKKGVVGQVPLLGAPPCKVDV